MQRSYSTRPRFYGRRKGRPLRQGMQALLTDVLPDLRFDVTRPLATQFKNTNIQQVDLALEIGFGGGEHLAGLAEANPAINFIGAEPFLNGVASLLRHIQRLHLSNISNVAYEHSHIEHSNRGEGCGL